MSLCQQSRNLHRVFDVLSRDSCLIGLAFFDEADRLNARERQNRDGKKENKNALHGLGFQPLVDLRLPLFTVSASVGNRLGKTFHSFVER